MSFLLTTNRKSLLASGLSEYEVGFENLAPPSGETGTTSLSVIEKRSITKIV